MQPEKPNSPTKVSVEFRYSGIGNSAPCVAYQLAIWDQRYDRILNKLTEMRPVPIAPLRAALPYKIFPSISQRDRSPLSPPPNLSRPIEALTYPAHAEAS